MRAPVYVVERFPERSQTFVLNELRALHRIGVRPRVFALYPPADPADDAGDLPFAALGSAASRPLDVARSVLRVMLRHPLGLARALVLAARRPSRLQVHSLAKALLLVAALEEVPDRFHAHFARASASTAMLAAAMVGRPFSFTAHALDVFVDPFDMDRKLARADVTVTVCEYNRRFLAEHWPGKGNVVVIPCGVDTASFDPSRHREPSVFTLVAVGRLVPKKGFDDLVRAIAQLVRDGASLRCVLIGEGPERPRLEALITEHGLSGTVELLGSVPPSMVQEVLETASVFCLPCVVAEDGDRDSQPVVIKEAMAVGLPVVGTDAVGVPEMIDETVGRLVAPHDPDALAAALAGLLALPAADRQALGRAARVRVEQHFALDPLVGRLAATLGMTRTRAGAEPRRE